MATHVFGDASLAARMGPQGSMRLRAEKSVHGGAWWGRKAIAQSKRMGVERLESSAKARMISWCPFSWPMQHDSAPTQIGLESPRFCDSATLLPSHSKITCF